MKVIVNLDEEVIEKIVRRVLEKEGVIKAAGGPTTTEKQEKVLAMTLAQARMPARLINAVWRKGIQTMRDLCRYTELELLSISDIGPRTVHEIKGRCRDLGVELGSISPDKE